MRLRDMSTTDNDFTEFVRGCGTQLYRSALLLTGGDHHLAEDLTQTALAKAYASWRRVQRTDNPVGYVHKILLNSFLSHRRMRRTGEIPTEALSDEGVTDADPDLRLDLLAAIGQLSPVDRAIVVARYWADRSISETAAATGLSETNVKTRSKRALERLRPYLIERIP